MVVVGIGLTSTIIYYNYKCQKRKKNYWGIDLSHHQQYLSYETLINENKPDFVYLKSTEGKSFVDPEYQSRLLKFRELNIPVGAYHFFRYDVSGKEQAENYLKTAQIKRGDLYPVLDVEMRYSSTRSKQWITSEIKSFCDLVKQEYNVNPILYCENDYYQKYLKEGFNDYDFWISDFVRAPRCDYIIWQYDTLNVKGVKGKIDNNKLHSSVDLNQIILK